VRLLVTDPAADWLLRHGLAPSARRLAVLGRVAAATPGLAAAMPGVGEIVRLPKAVYYLPTPIFARRLARVDAAASWGVGRSYAERCRRFARREGIVHVALEDGFLRSVGPAAAGGGPAASLVADPVGVYYDATRPSALEILLEEGGWETPALLARAETGLGTMRRLRLTKYLAPPGPAPDLPEGPLALVLDQRRGDMSVALSGADEAAFAAMLDAAARENPDATIMVKLHPDELSGRHVGHLGALARARGVAVCADPVDPWLLLERARTVYTVSSLLGFEALVAGCAVRCFGLPFYAGWGVTLDELRCPRRTRRRRIAEIFAAAYLLYARYVDPATGRSSTFEATAAALAALRDGESAPAGAAGRAARDQPGSAATAQA
jgi:capsular polysaccharide export protein